MSKDKIVQNFKQLQSEHLYKVKSDRNTYFTIHNRHNGNFYWVDEDNEIIQITNSPDFITTENVDEKRSFVGLHYYAGDLSKHSDIPVQTIKQDINKEKYIHIGPLEENKHLIDY